jgi:hypothetical protein
VPKVFLLHGDESVSFWRYYRGLLHEQFGLLRAVEDLHDPVNVGKMAAASLGNTNQSGTDVLSVLKIMKNS